MSLLCLGAQDDPLPVPTQQDALVSCAAVVMQTLRELGAPRPAPGSSPLRGAPPPLSQPPGGLLTPPRRLASSPAHRAAPASPGIGAGEKRPDSPPDPDVEKGLADFVSNALLMTDSGRASRTRGHTDTHPPTRPMRRWVERAVPSAAEDGFFKVPCCVCFPRRRFSLFKLELQHQMDRGEQQGYSEARAPPRLRPAITAAAPRR